MVRGSAGPATGVGGPVLLVVGDVVTDIVARPRARLATGTDTATRISLLPGGAGANVAAWAAYSGAGARLLARAGADAADWHAAQLRRAGVEPHIRVDPDAPTGKVIALVDPDTAERTFLTDSGAAFRLGPADWDPALLADTSHVHLSGYLLFTEPGRALTALLLREAHARGATVSVDPASTGFLQELGVRDFLAAVRGVDVLLPNASEACLLTGETDPERAAARLSAEHGTAVVTVGAAGALLAEGGELTHQIPAPPAVAVDSTGAGDAFTGAYLATALTGAVAATAAKAGCRAGALAVALVGGRPPERDGGAPCSSEAESLGEGQRQP